MRGIVSADWLVAIMIFLVFVSFSFVYYTQTVRQKAHPLADTKEFVADQITGYLFIDTYEIPVQYSSGGPQSDAVLHFDYSWPNGEPNTTRVFMNGASQPCTIDSGTLYWESDLVAGTNNFTVRYSDNNVSSRCTDSLSGGTQVIPWSEEYSSMLSQDRVDEMNSTPYGTFKSSLAVDRDFRIELNISGTNYTYGPPTPTVSDVYIVRRFGKTEENGEQADIRIHVW